jgi:glutaminyl-peptide cyclotransferase
VVCVAGCGKPAPTEQAPPLEASNFNGERALFEVHSLVALGARDAGTPGAERAAQYLKSRLQELGVEASVDTFTNQTPLGVRAFHNVIGRIPGTRPGLILLGSHFDTKSGIAPDFQGANDSGSSTGALLELARLLAKHGSPGPEIHLLFFDGEEAVHHYSDIDGLHGSRHHAQRMVDEGRDKDVLAMILMDMIGDRDLSVTIPRNVTRELAIALLRAADAEGQREKFVLFPFEIGDDHEPFLRRGMPALNIIDFQFGSAPGRNDYWHTRLDTLDKLSAESLGLIGRVTIRIVQDVSAQTAAR